MNSASLKRHRSAVATFQEIFCCCRTCSRAWTCASQFRPVPAALCRCGNIHHCVRCPPKTIYNYTIKTDCAHLDYYLHYPDFASSLFKGIAIAVILVFVLIAALTGSILFLIGPVAVAFVAAVKLLNWENPIHHEQSLPWGEYNYVTVDRKRLMIITHRTDVTLGFEARFQHEVLFNKYLSFPHTVLTSTAEFTEKAWKW
ncbi:Permease [Pseudomonas coronafaciens pv. porri]|nr:Permease [Pseudomonas coronafaciens pv. porri]RMV92096.1 Permease [Pseudomonas coronafaciens pv. porri]RMW11453.1 Permease [Pseudomonas coronafaciens pv. porri]